MDLKELRALCDAATDGEWKIHLAFNQKTEPVYVHTNVPKDQTDKNLKSNARFIAATDPQTVRALIDEIERKDKALQEIATMNRTGASSVNANTMRNIAQQALEGTDNE